MNQIAELLKKENKALSLIDIVDKSGLEPEVVMRQLQEAQAAGLVFLSKKKNKYAWSEVLDLALSRVFMLRSGVPIARPLSGAPEMRINRAGDMRAMHGDLVLVHPDPKVRPGETLKCYLAAIIERAHDCFVGVLTEQEVREQPPAYFVRRGHKRKRVMPKPVFHTVLTARPYDVHMVCKIDVVGDLLGAKPGDAVELKIVDYPRHGVPLKAQVTRVLGNGGSAQVQLRALLDGHGIREDFPEDALAEAESLPGAVREEDLAGRFDARGLSAFTIDGEDAKDFDDAVSLEKTEDGAWELGVHIADVSYYVRRGGAIDREALARGTSVYLPGLTVPMLPEALCNGLCSLRPDVDRLTLSVFLRLQDGAVVSHRLTPAVIHSRARLTYTQVNRLFAGQENQVPEALHQTLFDMLSLSKTLRRAREERGAIDFELSEPQFVLDASGEPVDVRPRQRGEAERLIEDFMLAANEQVARIARERDIPFLYRVHEDPDPDRLHTLEVFLANLGHPTYLGGKVPPAVLRRLLLDTAGLPESEIIRHVMLRSLKKACYSESPQGHYGLAAPDYCHFTSPIRRYPDLTVHRMLRRMLAGDPSLAAQKKNMHELAMQCSATEQEAVAVERDADDLMRARFMQGREGQVFKGVVSGVTDWGYYVALPNTVEGLVHVRELPGYYQFNKERQALIREDGRHVVRLGDPVKVRLLSVDTMAGEINFTPA